MAVGGNSIIKGIEINEVIRLLNRAYADEWLAYYQYFIESKVVKGIMKDAADELRHANCGYDAPSNFDVVKILEDAIKGEQCAISTYSEIVELTRNKDIVTYNNI